MKKKIRTIFLEMSWYYKLWSLLWMFLKKICIKRCEIWNQAQTHFFFILHENFAFLITESDLCVVGPWFCHQSKAWCLLNVSNTHIICLGYTENVLEAVESKVRQWKFAAILKSDFKNKKLTFQKSSQNSFWSTSRVMTKLVVLQSHGINGP